MMRSYYPRALVLLEPVLDRLTTDGTAGRTLSLQIEPAAVSVTITPAEQADTAEVTIQWLDLPLDARMLRDVRVTVYMEDVRDPAGSIDPAGLGGLATTASDSGGLYGSFTIGRRQSRPRFIGFVDEPESSHDESGDTIRLTARDYRGRLMDVPNDAKSFDATKGAGALARQIAAQIPGYEKLTIRVVDSDGNDAPDDPLTRYTGRRLWTPRAGSSLWDCIVQIAADTGRMAWMDLGTLYIGDPRGVAVKEAIYLGYGVDIDRMTLRRNMNPIANRAVAFRARNPRTGKVTEGRWPIKASKNEKLITYPLTADFTVADLQGRAKIVYESRDRWQIGGAIALRHMNDREGNEIPAIRNGQPIYIDFRDATPDLALGQSRSALVEFMAYGGIDRVTAEAITDAYLKAAELKPLFYVYSARHEWRRASGPSDGGYSCALEVESYVTSEATDGG